MATQGLDQVTKRIEEGLPSEQMAVIGDAFKKAVEAHSKLKYEMAVMSLPVVAGEKSFDTTEVEKWQKMVKQQEFHSQILGALHDGTVKNSAVSADGVPEEVFNKAVRDSAMKRLSEDAVIGEAKDFSIADHVANLFDRIGLVKNGRVNKSQFGLSDFTPDALGQGNKKQVAEIVFHWGDEEAAMKTLGVVDADGYQLQGKQNLKSIYTGQPNNPVQTAPDPTNGYGGYVCGLQIDPTVILRESPIMDDSCFNYVPATGSRILYTREAFTTNNFGFVPESIYQYPDSPDTDPQDVIQPARYTTKPELHMGFQDVAIRLGKLAGRIWISEETFEDCPTIANAVRSSMERLWNEKKMSALLQGDGVFPNVLGIYNQTGMLSAIFQGAPRGTEDDTRRDFLRRIRTDLQMNGCSTDICALIHPYDLEEMELEKNSFGEYLIEVPSDCMTTSVWCVKMMPNAYADENNMIVGNIGEAFRIHERQSMRVWIGYVGTSAHDNMLSMIVEGRFGTDLRKPWCLVSATGM